jgi:hypothetical protein
MLQSSIGGSDAYAKVERQWNPTVTNDCILGIVPVGEGIYYECSTLSLFAIFFENGAFVVFAVFMNSL